MKEFLIVLKGFIVAAAMLLGMLLVADWYITEVRGHVYEAPAKQSGTGSHWSSPNATAPARGIGGYKTCRLTITNADGEVWYDKETYCYRA